MTNSGDEVSTSVSSLESKKKYIGYAIAAFVFMNAFSNIFYLKGFKAKMGGRRNNMKQAAKNVNLMLHPEKYVINSKSLDKAKQIFTATHKRPDK